MDNLHHRRTFLKKGAALGATAIIGPALWQGATLAKTPTGVPDIAVIKGTKPFDMTLKAVEIIGGMPSFVQKGSTVGLLINGPEWWGKPGSHTNTDVVLAAIKMCLDAGAKEITTLCNLSKDFWKRSNLSGSFQTEIASLKPASGEYREVGISNGVKLRKAKVAKELLDCDVYINIPVSKHHAGTGYTGIMKNFMGACPSDTNSFFHNGSGAKGEYDDVEFLSRCIADVNLVRQPNLCIIDGMKFLITNGPGGPGDIKTGNTVVAAKNLVSADAYGCTLLGNNPSDIPMINYAYEYGLGEMNLSKLKIFEENI